MLSMPVLLHLQASSSCLVQLGGEPHSHLSGIYTKCASCLLVCPRVHHVFSNTVNNLLRFA